MSNILNVVLIEIVKCEYRFAPIFRVDNFLYSSSQEFISIYELLTAILDSTRNL